MKKGCLKKKDIYIYLLKNVLWEKVFWCKENRRICSKKPAYWRH